MLCSTDFFGIVLVATTLLVLTVNCKIAELDSFDESFEDSTNVSREFNKSLLPAEDAFIGFINRLVNTGYASSKIALNRIEKESQKRREFGDRLEEFLAQLPSYKEEIPVVDQVPRTLKNNHINNKPPVQQPIS